MKEIYANQNDTLAAICWREYGRSSGVVEILLNENPHLSEFGPFIPMGTKILIPDIPTQQNKIQSVQLWD
ncbi:tail protein X [Acinetobacter sp. ANC 5659]|uniref:tail protein X n=1 Tax=Acinetobacter higginsii TaxID=70347 RepID=UPI001F4BC99C|nr:tail protein X [Acinetobacter higginsii]